MIPKSPCKTLFFLVFSCIFAYLTAPFAHASETLIEEDPLAGAVFFGESTTTHLRSRGGIPSAQVWANESGTMRLDSAILSRTVTDTQTEERLSVSEMITRVQPPCLVLSFGLNGILAFSENRDSYLGNYKKLIRGIQERSPETRIVIQSVYPVATAEAQTDWHFSCSPAEINQRITRLNGWLRELCASTEGVTYADTAFALTDSLGYLKSPFTTDGIHLTESAYQEILLTLRRELSKTE